MECMRAGETDAQIADPFGHVWSLATHKEDVFRRGDEQALSKIRRLAKLSAQNRPKEEITMAASPQSMPEAALPPQMVLYQMATGHYLSRAVGLATKLRIPDQFENGVRHYKEVAVPIRGGPASLNRVIRLLASAGIFNGGAPVRRLRRRLLIPPQERGEAPGCWWSHRRHDPEKAGRRQLRSSSTSNSATGSVSPSRLALHSS